LQSDGDFLVGTHRPFRIYPLADRPQRIATRPETTAIDQMQLDGALPIESGR